MMADSLFDETARAFAADIDASISADNYARGAQFLGAVRRWVPPGGWVLDFGCGPGRISRLLAEAGFRVDGVDPSSGMIAEASAQRLDGLSIDFRVATESPFVERYSGIVCSSVIEYVPAPLPLLARLFAALLPAGVLVLSFANRRSLWRRFSSLRNPAAPHLKLQHNIWSSEETAAYLRAVGFRIVEGPLYFDAAPFDRRPLLRPLSTLRLVGTLGLLVARRP